MFCKNCGAENLESAKFCKSCGTKFLYVQPKAEQQIPRTKIVSSIKKPKRKWKRWVFGMAVFIALVIASLFLFNLYKENHYSPVQVSFIEIYENSDSGFGIGTNGSLWVWGKNDDGQLGDGTTTNRRIPKQVISGGVKKVSMVSTFTKEHTFALKTDGSLWAWGSNESGQLGEGTKESSYLPKQIFSSGVKEMALGSDSTFALKTDGSLWAWGKNDYGQLGEGTEKYSALPKQIMASEVAQIRANGLNIFAIKTDGSLWAWGIEYSKVIGDGYNRIPKQLIASDVVDVVTGPENNDSVFVIKTDGSLWAWGENDYGQLGDGTKDNSFLPKQIIDSGIKELVPGQYSTFALKADGSLWAWGSNKSGQLGDGTKDNSFLPKKIIASDVNNVAAGSYQRTFALKKDGSLWVWGANEDGQFGDRTNDDSYLPKQIIDSGIKEARASNFRTFALKTDGSLWAWGYNGGGSLWSTVWNSGGYLGDGTTIDRLTPKQIISGSGSNQSITTSEQTNSEDVSNQPLTTSVLVAPDFVCGTSQVKDVDDNAYDTVQVGDQCWMASNIKVGKKIKGKDNPSDDGNIEKWCYEDHDSSCDSGGGLYSWSEAMQYATTEGTQGICPVDWHVPTDTEQNKLENFLKDPGENCSANRTAKGCASAGTKLKSGGSSNLNFPLAGFYYNGKYSGRGTSANFWSSTKIDSINTWDRLIFSDKSAVVRDSSLNANGFSVRCIKN